MEGWKDEIRSGQGRNDDGWKEWNGDRKERMEWMDEMDGRNGKRNEEWMAMDGRKAEGWMENEDPIFLHKPFFDLFF
ncbi:hypothetical protein [Klebsiella pneumoniae]|uniref:hypothetical protein n=1 Tax=Klebsiella pneumoniae TaxID=573 RepID=UPI0011587EAF|nr:hypothetical protein [Klebsiella pneumoniae]